ncbi:sigma-54 interaction domain-containing protein [Desulfonatronum thiodismutans]|uniref:sigma-54 interaction domain-containing protein n=1 Tax=Desulfonatronum thiodismutans TaxID=159290 RepID=UPI00068FBE0B|nr:sigma-54 dependent transcriptional regulator [Desulfonatronum thiodismutans]
MNTTEDDHESLSPRLEQLLTIMEHICNDLAWGRYDRAGELFELTRNAEYPSPVAKLAESFGLMLVKVEAREYRLEGMVAELRRVGDELRDARRRLLLENQGLKQGLVERYSAKRIVGQSPPMRTVLGQVERIADTSISVLITGETGTGKELLAKALHYNSPRKAGPFIALNCSAVPETLFERELFGIEKGVATGVLMHRGLLEQAQGGTLLLDEIADMPLSCQGKLLRVLEERELTRVGGTRVLQLDVRILAATNKDMTLAVQSGAFRGDLFFRLNVMSLHLPPLRERREDIVPLTRHFLDLHSRSMGRDQPRLAKSALEALASYDWPGNVRELSNEMERLVALSFVDEIHIEDLSPGIRGNQEREPAATTSVALDLGQVRARPSKSPELAEPPAAPEPAGSTCIPSREASSVPPIVTVPVSLLATEKMLILNALRSTQGNKTQAAKVLGISREGLRKKLKRLGITE